MKQWCSLAVGMAVFLAGSGITAAQNYPVKPVRILIGLSAGGATDVITRVVAQRLSETWGQSAIVENRPGATGMIAGEFVAKAAPDGYTLMVGFQSGLAVAPALYGKAPYDTLKDFAPITLMGSTPLLMVVHPSFPVRTFSEFAAYAKKSAGVLTYGSGGIGSTPHMTGELLNTLLGVRMNHVPYKGEGPAIADTLGGQIPIMFGNLPVALPHAKSGKLRALANTSANRSPLMPDIPTIEESGFKGFSIATWYGLLAPAGTQSDIVSRIQRDAAQVMNQSQTRERLVSMGVDISANTPEAFAAFLRAEIPRYAKVIRDAKIKAE